MMLRSVLIGCLVAFGAGVGCATSEVPGEASAGDAFAALSTESEMRVVALFDRGGMVGIPTTEPAVGVQFIPVDGTGKSGRVTGYSGVNRFTGGYEIGEGGELEIGALASTRRAGPPALMRFETQMLDALGRSTLIERDGNEWVLSRSGEVTLRLRAE